MSSSSTSPMRISRPANTRPGVPMNQSSARKTMSRIERGAQVLAGHHQQGEHPGARQQRHEHVPPVGKHAELLLAGEQVRAPHGERELGQLGRLEPERAGDGDPPGRAVHVRADPRDEHQAEPDRRDREQRVGRRRGTAVDDERAATHMSGRRRRQAPSQLLLEVANTATGPRPGRPTDAVDSTMTRPRPEQQQW